MVAPTARESYESIADGVQATTANTSMTHSGTGTRVVRSAAAIKGARGCEYAGTNLSAFGEFSGAGMASRSGQWYFRKTSTLPTGASHVPGQIRNSTGIALEIRLTTTGVLQIVNATGGNLRQFNSNTELPNGDYVLSVACTRGTTTSNGRVQAWLRDAVTDALVETYDSGTAINAGTTDLTTVRGGKVNGTGVSSLYMDEIAHYEGFGEIDRVANPVTGTPTQQIRRYQDFASFTGGAGALEATVTQDSGPTITPVQESDLAWYFVDDPERDTNVVLNYTVAGATSGSASGQIIVLPGGGQLIIARSELYTDGTGWA